jgi:hypothetical protein
MESKLEKNFHHLPENEKETKGKNFLSPALS